MLAALGYEPVGFEHGTDALAASRAEPARFDASVISDDSATSACLLARKLHETVPLLPIILATASAIEVGAETLASAGVTELLRRPLTSAELAAALARVLPSPATLPT
jgi:CheY-like chemotaxis protein